MTIQVGKIDPELLPFVWDDVTALVVERGPEWLRTVALSDIFQMISNERMDLWGATENDELIGVLFASWTRHRFEADYHVNWIAGTGLRKWLRPGIQKIEQYVALHHGTALLIGGRVGWHKLLEPMGYEPFYAAKKFIHSMKGVH